MPTTTLLRQPGFAALAALTLGALYLGTPATGLAKESKAATTIAVSGLEQPVDLLVDRWGVPHIFAGNEADAFFAQGFNAARDRLFQLDLWRRRGLGELSSVLGPSYVEQDRAARLFLYRGDIGAEWAVYSSRNRDEARSVAEHFVRGINAYIDYVAANPHKLPWEFRELGYRPEKWSAEDVVRIRSHGLVSNLPSEIARARTACKAHLDADQVRAALEPPWQPHIPDGVDLCLPEDVMRVYDLATQAVSFPAIQSKPLKQQLAAAEEGSNSWVISAAKSATGRAVMANDPHRAYSIPSLRYLVHVSAPGLDFIGAGEPALPGVALGHNGTIAFGLTIFNIDQADLYVLELNPGNPNQYRFNGAWEDLRTVRETIAVRDAPTVTTELQFARQGPVIYTDSKRQRAYAVRTVWLEPGTSPYYGSLDYLRAHNFDEFRRALLNWGAPPLNQVYADKAGNIGWAPGGRSPKRAKGDGLLPVPGNGDYEWTGFWRGDELPFVYNPANGYVATANQLNLPPAYYPLNLAFEWSNRSRFERISEVLDAKPKVSFADSLRLQADELSLPARRLVKLLAPLQSADPATRSALAMLKGWDAVERVDAAQPALFEIWLSRHLTKAFRSAVLSPEAAKAISSTDVAAMLEALEQPVPRLGTDRVVAERKRDELLLTSLGAAYGETRTLLGEKTGSWQWGRLHHNQLQHPLSARVDETTRRKIDVERLAKGGGSYTPNVAPYREGDFRQLTGPSVRIVIDVGSWDESRAVNHPGQSGDPDSSHYRDLAKLWQKSDYFPLLYSREAIEKAAETRIRLSPAN